jgi:hypothetical protein
MNGKQAKRMRKSGKVDKDVKRLYNTLSHTDREILNKVYKLNIEREK